MFDGSFRTRREVNLGGSKQRRKNRKASTTSSSTSTTTSLLQRPSIVTGTATTDGKSRVLQEARLKRQERHERQRRELAAKNIQRCFRGYTSRVTFVTRLCCDRTETTRRPSLILSMRLSSPLVRFLKQQSGGIRQALLDYYYYDQQHDTASERKEKENVSILSQRRILHAALQELRPTTSSSSDQMTTMNNGDKNNTGNLVLLNLVTNILDSSPQQQQQQQVLGGMFGLVELTACCKEWLWLSSSGESSSDATTTTTTSNITNALWQWSCRLALGLEDTTEAHALLAGTILLSRPHLFDEKSNNNSLATDSLGLPGTQQQQQWYHDVLLPSLMSVLDVDNDETATTTKLQPPDNNNTNKRSTYRVVSDMVAGRECILLSNAFGLMKSSLVNKKKSDNTKNAMLRLVQIVLERRKDLAFLTSLVVRGDDLKRYVDETTKSSVDDNNMDVIVELDQDDDDDESDSFDEDDDVRVRNKRHRSTTTTTATTTRSSSRRLTRQDLQTLPKLDRLYQEDVLRLRKETLDKLQQTSTTKKSDGQQQQEQQVLLVELALQLGSPTLWLEWGNAIFLNREETSTAWAARKAYVMLLCTLLQASTGLRPLGSGGVSSSSSLFLTQLAFHRGLLEGLWRCIHVWTTNGTKQQEEDDVDNNANALVMATTVFCDLFAHHLLALNDEEFLQNYTTAFSAHHDGAAASDKVILAEHVIVKLRLELYELYWTKPVVAKDVCVPGDDDSLILSRQLRGRLLLSGTKLWNSLYERWCRLVRHAPFCDESTWWFPRLVCRDDDAAVNIHPGDTTSGDNESVVPMDIDEESEEEEEEEEHHGAPRSAAEVENDALAEAFRDPKMARVLTCVPQALPFDRRVKLFSSLLTADKQKTQDESLEFRRVMAMMQARGEDAEETTGFLAGREHVEIRRDALYDDSMNKLNRLGRKLKKKVQVTFINQHGATEPGIDGGGVFKEFLDDLIKQAFDPDNEEETGAPQLFSVTPLQTLTVNVAAYSPYRTQQDILSHYEFLGRVLGKAVYESILVEPQFCLPFLNQLLGKQNSLDDLKNFDPEYYKNLTKLRNMDAKDIDASGLTFELTASGANNTTRTFELVPGGASIPVTKQNVIQYVHIVAHQRLNKEGAPQTRAFLRGFRDLIPASWVRLFSSNELQKLISGDDTVRGIDVRGLKTIMQYSAGYHPSQRIIVWFWQVVEEMTPEQQRKLLKFMTSCSRQPLLGFQALEPHPCIQQIRLPDELFDQHTDIDALSKVTPLPTSATCMNLLKLPNYRSKELLKRKLLAAVESGAGFELT